MRFKNSSGGGGEGKEFERPAVGGHLAVLVRIDDIGYQRKVYKGEEKVRPKSVLTWELESCDSKGSPFVAYSIVPQTLSGGSNPLPKIIEALMGRVLTEEEMEDGVDDRDLIGKVAYVHIVAGREDESKRYVGRVDPVQGSARLTKRGNYLDESRFVTAMKARAVRPGTGESISVEVPL